MSIPKCVRSLCCKGVLTAIFAFCPNKKVFKIRNTLSDNPSLSAGQAYSVCRVGLSAPSWQRSSSSRIFAVLSLISVSCSPFAVFVFGAVVALHVAAAMLYQQLYSRIEEYGGGKRADNAPKHHIVFCVKYARLIYDKRHDVGKANLKSDCKPTRFRAVQFSERSGDCRNAGGRKQIEGHKGISGQRSEHCSVHA